MYLTRYIKSIKSPLAARLFLAVIIGLVMLGSLSAPVQAQEVDLDLIDLELGGEGATNWNIEGILPCSSGVKTVTLHNAGTEDGFVTIWISDIVSGEGKNPEPETNKTGEGELDDHLLFNLSTDPSGRIETDISLPTTINDLPPSAAGPGYIWINPLNGGETITLYWEWELPCGTDNDAQGDTLSFTIHYLLEDFLEPPPTPLFAGGGPGPDKCYMIVDMLGERTLFEMNCTQNTTVEEDEAFDPEEIHLFGLELNTLVLCGDCDGPNCYPKIIVMSPSDETIDPPEGMGIVGPIYDWTGYKDIRQEFACNLVTYFDPVATVLLNYDLELLPEGAANPVVAFYDHSANQWVVLPPATGIVAEPGIATGEAGFFASPFTVLVDVEPVETPEAPPPAPEPANFVASGLSITPAEAKTGETVTISLNVTNDGDETGNYVVELKINGATIDSQTVTLGGGQSDVVSFNVSTSEAGTYEVTAFDLSGSFTVTQSSLWWLYVIIAAVVIIAGLLTWRLTRKSASKKA
jgi:hypothetical protein